MMSEVNVFLKTHTATKNIGMNSQLKKINARQAPVAEVDDLALSNNKRAKRDVLPNEMPNNIKSTHRMKTTSAAQNVNNMNKAAVAKKVVDQPQKIKVEQNLNKPKNNDIARKPQVPNSLETKVHQVQQMDTTAKVPQLQSDSKQYTPKVVIIKSTKSEQATPQLPKQNFNFNFKLRCPNCETPYSLKAHFPITICKSGETICLQCLNTLQASKKSCPFCESHLIQTDQFPPNKFAIQFLELQEGKFPQQISLISRNLIKVREKMGERIGLIETLLDNAKSCVNGINKNFMNLEGNKYKQVEVGEVNLKILKDLKAEIEEALQKAESQLVNKNLELQNQQ